MKCVRCLARGSALLAFGAMPLAPALALDGKSDPYPMDFTPACGIVELVEPVLLDKGRPGLPDVFEHAVRPEIGDRLLIRLDGGHAVTVVDEGLQRFQPGQRVRVVSGGSRKRSSTHLLD